MGWAEFRSRLARSCTLTVDATIASSIDLTSGDGSRRSHPGRLRPVGWCRYCSTRLAPGAPDTSAAWRSRPCRSESRWHRRMRVVRKVVSVPLAVAAHPWRPRRPLVPGGPTSASLHAAGTLAARCCSSPSCLQPATVHRQPSARQSPPVPERTAAAQLLPRVHCSPSRSVHARRV